MAQDAQTGGLLMIKRIYPRKFVAHEVPDNPDTVNGVGLTKYRQVSNYHGYYPSIGIYKIMGWEYDFRPLLKLYWYQNGYSYGCSIQSAYATSITDLKRVLRAHYESISKDFIAIEVQDVKR